MIYYIATILIYFYPYVKVRLTYFGYCCRILYITRHMIILVSSWYMYILQSHYICIQKDVIVTFYSVLIFYNLLFNFFLPLIRWSCLGPYKLKWWYIGELIIPILSKRKFWRNNVSFNVRKVFYYLTFVNNFPVILLPHAVPLDYFSCDHAQIFTYVNRL